jgi:predicted helicase
MTATQKIIEVDDGDETESFSLDNKNIYGDIIHEENIESCIEKGLLCDYKLFLYNHTTSILELANQLVNIYIRKRIIIFFNSIDNSKLAYDVLNKTFKCYHIDANTSLENRQNILSDFDKEDDEIRIICNVNIISEGSNLVLTDCVIFAEKRNSNIGIIQNMGRALRIHNSKNFAIIAIPDSVDQFESVILACKMQDSRISNNQLYTYNIKHKQIDDKIKKRCSLLEIEKHGGLWNYKYQLCIDYELNCSDDIKLSTTYKDNKIGKWLSLQFSNYKKNLLSSEQLIELNKLKNWINKIKHLQVSLKNRILYILSDYKKRTAREIYNEIKSKNMWRSHSGKTPEQTCNAICGDLYRADLLNRDDSKLPFTYYKDTTELIKLSWDEMYNLCVNYEKTAQISINTRHNNYKLGIWIDKQKKRYKKKQLKEPEINKLKQLKCFKI